MRCIFLLQRALSAAGIGFAALSKGNLGVTLSIDVVKVLEGFAARVLAASLVDEAARRSGAVA